MITVLRDQGTERVAKELIFLLAARLLASRLLLLLLAHRGEAGSKHTRSESGVRESSGKRQGEGWDACAHSMKTPKSAASSTASSLRGVPLASLARLSFPCSL